VSRISAVILVDGRPMRPGKERINLVSLRIEPDRVRPRLRLDGLDKPHPSRIPNVDHTGIANRHVKMAQLGIEEDDIGRTTQRQLVRHLAGVGVQANQSLRIAGTEEPLCFHVQIQPVRTCRRDLEGLCDPRRITCLDHDDARRFRDIDEKHILSFSKQCPSRAPRHGYARDYGFRFDIDN
jgi:hypothetical protein